jgi:hypothetical protein
MCFILQKFQLFSTILSALSFFGILSSFKMCIIIFCLSTLLSVCFSISRYFLSGICGIDLFPSQTCNMASQRIVATLFQRTIFWDAWEEAYVRIRHPHWLKQMHKWRKWGWNVSYRWKEVKLSFKELSLISTKTGKKCSQTGRMSQCLRKWVRPIEVNSHNR